MSRDGMLAMMDAAIFMLVLMAAIAVTLQWWLFASLVCLGYATLGTLLALI